MGIERQREALGIPNKLSKLAEQIVNDTVKRPPMPRSHDYRKLLDHFAKGLQPDQMQELVERFPPGASDMSGSFLMVAQAALEHLKQLFPMSVYTTFTGPTNLTPDDDSVWRFFSQLEVLNDPMRVFPLIACGALLRSQVKAMREIYPTLSAAIDTAAYEAIAKKTAEAMPKGGAPSRPFRLPPRAEMGLAVWLGRRLISHQPPPPPGAPAPGPAATPSQKMPNAMATRTQKAIANT